MGLFNRQRTDGMTCDGQGEERVGFIYNVFHNLEQGILLLCLCCVCSSCTSVHEGREVIAVADSLRMHRGVAYGNGVPTSNMQRGVGDSIALAQAYTTFGRVQHIYPNEYARACYYYGRLLRNHGDQVAAMQAFINGSHAPYWHRLIPLPQFTDYHILGRIYSNMGTMCHLEGDYELSYEMYKKCSEQFLRSGDTTAYYYAINDMAFCRAMQKNRSETSLLLGSIEKECTDSNVIAKTWETRAILYKNIIQYDSAIWAANHVSYNKNFESTSCLIKAQAFSRRGMNDSALHYANRVMSSSSASYQDKYNALYILTNKDSAITSHDKDSLVAVRADIGMYQTHDAKLLGHAIEILQQDNKEQPIKGLVILLMIVLIMIGVLLGVIRMLRQQQLKKVRHIIHKAQSLSQHTHQLEKLQQEKRSMILDEIGQTCTTLQKSTNLDELCWNNYGQMCACVNKRFYSLASKLQERYDLSEREIRLCILVLIGFDRKQTSELLRYSLTGIGKLKDTTAKKMGTTGAELQSFLSKLTAE